MKKLRIEGTIKDPIKPLTKKEIEKMQKSKPKKTTKKR